MTYETFGTLIVLLPAGIGFAFYIITLFATDTEWLATALGIAVAALTIVLFGFFGYSPQLYENSYNKMLEDRPPCLNDSTASSLGCLDKYVDWKKDSIEITKRYLENREKIELKLNEN